MHLDNPAIYECKSNSKNRLHWWKRNPDGTASCAHCKLVLNKQHADECFRDYERWPY
jgi:hypothetical protein